jgi:hypothetical protein
MVDELEVLKIVVKRLNSAGISYMITGSIAVNFYATPRMTRDIDIIIEVGKNDARKLFSIFSDDFYVDEDSIKDALKNQQVFNIIHNEGLSRLILLSERIQSIARQNLDADAELFLREWRLILLHQRILFFPNSIGQRRACQKCRSGM